MILLISLRGFVDHAFLCRKKRVLLRIRKQEPDPLPQPWSTEITLVAGITESAQDQDMLQATALPLLINFQTPLKTPDPGSNLRGAGFWTRVCLLSRLLAS